MSSSGTSFGLLLIRLALGTIFIAHGGQKVFGWWGGHGLEEFVKMMTNIGFPAYMGYLAAFTELAGGVAVMIGLLTRLAGLGLAIVMGVAIWRVHLPNGFFMNWFNEAGKGHGMEYSLALLAMALCLLFAGAGSISMDCACRRKKSHRSTTFGSSETH